MGREPVALHFRDNVLATHTHARYLLLSDDPAELGVGNPELQRRFMEYAAGTIERKKLGQPRGVWVVGLAGLDEPGWERHIAPAVVAQIHAQMIATPGLHWRMGALVDSADLAGPT